jgi:hypothetical protein
MPESAIGNPGARESKVSIAPASAPTERSVETSDPSLRTGPTSGPGGNRSELESSSTAGLISELVTQAGVLARKEIELAKRELHEDLRREAVAAGQLGIAGVAGILTLNLLLVTAVLALTRAMPGWVAGLLISAATLIVAVAMGISGWRRIKRPPLERTRRTLKDDAQWAKESFT